MNQVSGDIAAIAAGLSEAQRDCFQRSTGIGCVAKSVATANALIGKGIATCEVEFQPRTLDWTPLGLAVRAYLEGQSHE
jgi:hypothetical protein